MSEQAGAATYDVTIIGGGPGGYVAAIRAGQLGLKTALIEREHLGGICLNWGCIPTKSLLHDASVLDQVKQADRYGITFDNLRVDYSKSLARSRQAAQRLQKGVEFLMKKNNVDVIEGTGSLAGPDKVRVTTNDGQVREVSSRHIILATGARPRSIPGVEPDGERIMTSRHILALDTLPSSLVIIGGGAIGVEFASLYTSHGVAVSIVEMEPRLLPLEDEEVSQELERLFRRRKVGIHTGVRVEAVEPGQDGVTVRLSDGKELQAETVLIAIGVQPNVENLGLEEAGVELTERGLIKLNEFMQTSVPHIYAIGDVAGPPYLAHVASEEGILAVEHLAGRDVRPLVYEDMPRVTFCTPQVASLGLTEQQARDRGIDVKVGKFPFRGIGRAVAVNDTDGFCKVVSDAKYGEILGVHMIGADVTELLAEMGLARTLEATIDEVAATVHAHPTLSEVLREAALAARGEPIHM